MYHGQRLPALFRDKRNILHLLSGKVDLAACPGDTMDMNAALNLTFLDDAQRLASVPLGRYDLVLADPP